FILSICANSSGISSTRSVLVMCIGVSMAANINILPQFHQPRKNLANDELYEFKVVIWAKELIR
ncbi:MAG: hypothetical protein Q7U18_00530, partial [Methylobacter sp.]|nr:hypothetical protein [Methylobacter sp.]